jgi:hypothetical protein
VAWKDENFREALIADPKGVIQRLFPQCFPNGEAPKQLTIKVIEEDPYSCHIVIPSLPDEFPTPEIPEEEQLELFANMGCQGMTMRTDSSERRESKPPEKPKHDFSREDFNRKQADQKKQTSVSGDHHDSHESVKLPTRNEMKQALSQARQDKELLQELNKDPNRALQMLLDKYLPNHKFPEGVTFKMIQNKPDTHHIVLPSLPDASHNSALPEGKQLGPDFTVRCSSGCSNLCSDNCSGSCTETCTEGCSK